MKSKANVDWGSLPFGYYKTDYNVRASFIDGKWSDYKVFDSEYVDIHMAATCLHYGQEIFEGMKAFEGVDGVVRLFRRRNPHWMLEAMSWKWVCEVCLL